MISASAVPAVAVKVPRITVFMRAGFTADSSNITNLMLCSVKFSGVSNVVATGENAALTGRRKRKYRLQQHEHAQCKGRPLHAAERRMSRGAPYLPDDE